MGLSIVGNVPNERKASANNLVMYLMTWYRQGFIMQESGLHMQCLEIELLLMGCYCCGAAVWTPIVWRCVWCAAFRTRYI